MKTITTKINILSAEFLKLKSTPVIYLILACCLMITSMSLLASVLDVHNSVKLNSNPWQRYMQGGLAVFAIFMISPLSILLVSSVNYIEQRANAWKYLYTLPFRRGNIYFSKLITILILILLLCFGVILFQIVSGYCLDFFYPEYGFRYHTPDLQFQIVRVLHLFIGVLSVVGIQYFLTYVIQHFIFPLALGIGGFLVGFIMSAMNIKYSLYMPFAYPILARDQKMFKFDFREPAWDGSWLSNIEVYSIICFVIFIALGYIYEARKNVK